jgi:hypothetical protein
VFVFGWAVGDVEGSRRGRGRRIKVGGFGKRYVWEFDGGFVAGMDRNGIHFEFEFEIGQVIQSKDHT